MAGHTLPQHVTSTRRDGSQEILLHRSVAVFRDGVIELRSARSTIVIPAIGILIAAALGWAMINPTLLPIWAKMAALVTLLILTPVSVMALINSIVGAQVVIDASKQSLTWQQGYLGMGIGTRELVPFWKVDHLAIDIFGDEGDRWRDNSDDLRQFSLILVKQNGKRLTLAQIPTPAYGQEDGMDRTLAVGQAIAALVGTEVRLPESWQLVTIDVETGRAIDPSIQAGSEQPTTKPASGKRKRRSRGRSTTGTQERKDDSSRRPR